MSHTCNIYILCHLLTWDLYVFVYEDTLTQHLLMRCSDEVLMKCSCMVDYSDAPVHYYSKQKK